MKEHVGAGCGGREYGGLSFLSFSWCERRLLAGNYRINKGGVGLVCLNSYQTPFVQWQFLNVKKCISKTTAFFELVYNNKMNFSVMRKTEMICN